MALSGSTSKVYTPKGAFWTWVEWTATQSIANNTSTIVAITYGATNAYGYYSASSNGSAVTVDGTLVSKGDSGDISPNTTKKELARQTKTVTHESNGTKSVSISGRWWHSTVFDLTSSGTITLNTIPRYAKITSFTASNITRNTFKLNYTTDKTVSEVQYSTNGGAWTAFPSAGAFSGSANATYSMKIRVKASDSGLWTESSAVSVVMVKTASAGTPTMSSITRNSFKVSFTATQSISGFQVSTDDGATWHTKVSGSGTSGAQTITGLSAGTSYNVRVRVYDAVHTSTVSAASARATAKTISAASSNTPTLSSKTCVQAVVNWSSTQTVTEVQYKIGSGSWVSAGTFSARSSGSFTITGLTPGAAITIYTRVKDAVHASLSAQSGGLAVTTVALSSVSSSASFNLESALAVTISRPSTSLYHDLTIEAYYDSAWRAVAINTTQANKTTSGSLDPTSAAISTLFDKHPTSKTVSVRIKMAVRWGSSGTIQGTVYKTGTASIVNANPTIASVSYLDTSSAVQAILAHNQKILRNKSSLKVVAGAAASQKGAKLANYKVTIGGGTYSVNAAASVTSESGKEITVGAVNQSANQTVVLTVTDTRGNTATRSFTVQMLDYQNPQILQAVPQRLNSYEAPTTMLVEGRRYTVKPSAVDVNEVYVRYRLKENPSGAYGAWITLTRSNGSISGLWQAIAVDQYMADYPNTKSYTVELQISDKFTTWKSTILELSEGIAILRMMKDKMLAGVDLELLDNKGIILESPNGTRYILKVNDSGAITTAIA